jgi:hypothetical protein
VAIEFILSSDLLFQLRSDHSFLRLPVPFHVQQIRLATDLTVFHVGLAPTRRFIDGSLVPLAATRALKASAHLLETPFQDAASMEILTRPAKAAKSAAKRQQRNPHPQQL